MLEQIDFGCFFDLVVWHSGPDRWPQQTLPYHEKSRHWVEQFGTTCHLIKAPQWPRRVCDGPAWFDRVGKKLSVKADLLIYSNCVTISGQCLSVATITSNKMDFNSVYGWFSQIQSYICMHVCMYVCTCMYKYYVKIIKLKYSNSIITWIANLAVVPLMHVHTY